MYDGVRHQVRVTKRDTAEYSQLARSLPSVLPKAFGCLLTLPEEPGHVSDRTGPEAGMTPDCLSGEPWLRMGDGLGCAVDEIDVVDCS